MNKYLVVVVGLLGSATTIADVSDNEILARRGGAEVSHLEFDARMTKIPEQDRAAFLRDGTRVEGLIANLLLREQLAIAAREAGFDQDEVMQARLALAAQNELAEAWLEHYLDEQGEADVESLAREYYMLHPQEFMADKEVDASHILVSREGRPEEEARAMAQSILDELRETPEAFDGLILEHSEDPSVARNQGHFTGIGKGEMVKAFEDAAFALEVGELSGLVETPYGFHIIRVDAVHKPRVKPFDDIRQELEDRERARHRDRLRSDYLNQLANQEVEMTEEALQEMLSRYFDPEALANPADADSE